MAGEVLLLSELDLVLSRMDLALGVTCGMSNCIRKCGIEVDWPMQIYGYVILLLGEFIGCIGIPIRKDADSTSAVEHAQSGVWKLDKSQRRWA